MNTLLLLLAGLCLFSCPSFLPLKNLTSMRMKLWSLSVYLHPGKKGSKKLSSSPSPSTLSSFSVSSPFFFLAVIFSPRVICHSSLSYACFVFFVDIFSFEEEEEEEIILSSFNFFLPSIGQKKKKLRLRRRLRREKERGELN